MRGDDLVPFNGAECREQCSRALRGANIKHLDVEIGHVLGVPAALPREAAMRQVLAHSHRPVRCSLRHVRRSRKREGEADYCKQIRNRNLSNSD
jgi:hypothetical protein